MSKARTLADFISDGSEFADGTISVAEVSGAAPLASPTFTGSVTVPNLTTTGNVTFGDNDKALFGADGDLEIYHDGGNSRIWDKGNGNLIISASNFQVNDGTNGEIFIRAIDDSSVELRHSNNIKFVTTTSGVDITGEVKADKFTNDEALPDVRPSLLLDFANSKTLDPRITFTRGSTATYWDGHTTTKAEENLFSGSTTFSGGNFGLLNGSTKSSGFTAPDGTSTAYSINITTASTDFGPRDNTGWAAGTYTVSVYAKAGSTDYLQIDIQDLYAAYFTLTGSGTVSGLTGGASGTITSVGNGWYRCTLTASPTTFGFVDFQPAPSASTRTWDGTQSAGAAVYLWGPQLEQRSTATAYTATTTSPIVKYQPVLQTAASGEARFDHDPVTGESKGLLIEEARTNLIAYSDFTNSSGYNNIFKVGSSTAPDGTNTATILRASADAQYCYTFVGGLTLTQNTTYTYSVFVKAANSFAPNYIWLLGNTSTDTFNFIDPSTGTLGTSASGVTTRVEDVGDGWYRCAITFTNTQATGAQQIGVGFAQTNGSPQTSSDETQIEVWGEQIEVGSFPTSYIPTSGSTVTRSADNAYIDNISDWYSHSSGSTVYFEANNLHDYPTGNNYRTLEFFTSTTSSTGVISILNNVGTGYIEAGTNYGTSWTIGLLQRTRPAQNTDYKGAFAWSDTEAAFVVGDQAAATDTGYLLDAPNYLGIGRNYNNSAPINGSIKKIAYYPQRLSNATLQAMTEE